MQDKKPNKKKGLKVLLLIIATYIVVVSAIALYVKLNGEEQFVSGDNAVQQPKVKKKEVIEEVQPMVVDKNETIDTALLDDIKPITPTQIEKPKATPIVETEEEIFEKEYAKHLGSSLADVPAKSLEQDGEEVLIASDLTHEIEQPNGFFDGFFSFFGRVVDSIFSLFVSDQEKPKGTPKETASILAEIDGEIGEMQSHFSLYKESNGVTYIDHLNKPIVLESNGFYIYIGVAPNGFTFHRTIIRYSGADEIDLQSILVQTSSSDKASIIEASESVLQKKITTATNEWVDLPPTQENNTLLNSVVSSQNVKVTFMGAKKNVEWTLTEDEMITLKESLHFYNLLKEKEELSK